MTEYTRPSVYKIYYDIQCFDGEGSIVGLGNDYSRFGCHGNLANRSVEYYRAVIDGIDQLHYELDRFREHVIGRIREVEGATA